MSLYSIVQELRGLCRCTNIPFPLLSSLPGGDGTQRANELEMTMTYLACISSAQA